MIEVSRNATQANIELANKTLLEEETRKFKKLADTASHLKKYIDRQQRQERVEDE